MKTNIFIIALTVIFSLFVGFPATAEDQEPALEASIEKIQSAGPGCLAGDSVTASLSQDFKKLEINFPPFSAQIGPGMPKQERRKFCQVVLDVRHTDGWQYALTSVDFSLSAALDPKIKAGLEGEVYFQGEEESENLKEDFNGPVEFQLKAKVTIKKIFSICTKTRALNIKGAVKTLFKDGSQPIQDDPSSGIVTLSGPTTFEIEWRPCAE